MPRVITFSRQAPFHLTRLEHGFSRQLIFHNHRIQPISDRALQIYGWILMVFLRGTGFHNFSRQVLFYQYTVVAMINNIRMKFDIPDNWFFIKVHKLIKKWKAKSFWIAEIFRQKWRKRIPDKLFFKTMIIGNFEIYKNNNW